MSIEKLIRKALSDADIRRILGSDTRIIKYSNLAPYNSLDELQNLEIIVSSCMKMLLIMGTG